MIPIVASIIGGIIAGLKTPLISPILYLVKSRKDVFLILFFAYCIALCYEFELDNIYTADPLIILAVILPSILLLDSGLKGGDKANIKEIIFDSKNLLILPMLIGLFIKEVFIIAVLLALLHNFSEDHPKKGVLAVAFAISLLIIGLIVCEDVLDLIGGATTQVAFIAALTTFIGIIIFWRTRVLKMDMFTK